jgi:two-component system, chemotaxis family, response regulator Rcp1
VPVSDRLEVAQVMDAALIWDSRAQLFKKQDMHVLLLTEDPIDHAFFEQSITSLKGRHSFTACESLAEVWTKLTRRLISAPCLIFVDFELSRAYGHELIEMLKSNENLGTAPVIVLADSAEQEEIVAAYRLQAACFVVFPRDPGLLQQKIQACLDFWANYPELPELRRSWGEA